MKIVTDVANVTGSRGTKGGMGETMGEVRCRYRASKGCPWAYSTPCMADGCCVHCGGC
jgi:hypothetical protein